MAGAIEKILERFEALNKIPRCSGNETRVARWLRTWADENRFDCLQDATGNMVVRVPASLGLEKAPALVIQGHMDMVCEKKPGSRHDFNKDPIVHLRDGDWLTADGTTLGADNGIAIAYAMTLAEDKTVTRPPLELLFTVNEETGLSGVKGLDPKMLTGATMINLDSEDEGVFTIGCAGGRDILLSRTYQTVSLPPPYIYMELTVGGLIGGHSGMDINKHRGNANKLLAYILSSLHGDIPFHIVTLSGGSRHNAIPRDARARIACRREHAGILKEKALGMGDGLARELKTVDQRFFCAMREIPGEVETALDLEGTAHALNLLSALPNGVMGVSSAVNGAVETSCNLATVSLVEGDLAVLTSHRGANPLRMDQHLDTVRAIAKLAGVDSQDTSSYPPWAPDHQSPLLRHATKVFKKLNKKEPVLQIIHAGLECAIIGALIPGMDMISFGPNIRNAHSPDECISISSIENVWRLLVGVVETVR